MSPAGRRHVDPKCVADAILPSTDMSHFLRIVAVYRPPEHEAAQRVTMAWACDAWRSNERPHALVQ